MTYTFVQFLILQMYMINGTGIFRRGGAQQGGCESARRRPVHVPDPKKKKLNQSK